MKKHSTSQLLITAISAFAGGVLISLLVNPRSGAENRKWVSDNTSDFKSRVKESGKDIRSKNIPDLYKATEDLGLTDDDLLTGDLL